MSRRPGYLLVEAPRQTTWAEVDPLLRAELGLDPALVLQTPCGPIDPAAILGAEPLVDGMLLLAEHPGAHCRPAPATIAHLAVLSGPQAGTVLPLPAGEHVLGRSRYADLRVLDSALSRRHALLAVGPDRIHVHDLGSVNGTRVEGETLGSAPVELLPGALLQAGGSVLRVCGPPAPGAQGGRPAAHAHADGAVIIDVPAPPAPTSPTLACAPAPAPTIHFPTPPPPARASTSPWLFAVLPLLTAAVLAVALRNVLFLALGLMGPLGMLAHAGFERRRGRSDRADRQRRYEAALAEARRRLAEALEQERAAAHARHPPLPVILARATRHVPGVWQRTGLPWRVRCGSGIADSTVRVVHPDSDGGPPTPGSGRPRVADVPLTLDLDGRSVACCGGPADVAGLVRSVLIQLATHHPPDDVRLRLSLGARQLVGTDWPEWLPHLKPGDHPPGERELRVVTAAAADSLTRAPGAPGAPEEPGAPGEPGVGGALLMLIADPAAIAPEWCDTVVRVRPEGVTIEHRDAPGATDRLIQGRIELLGAEQAAAAARALAPLRTRGAHPGPRPRSAGLLDCLGLPSTPRELSQELVRRWSPEPAEQCYADRPGRVRIGDRLGTPGPCELDLDRDGPHLLLAGMTGAGKSELLATLVCGLVLNHPPQELALVLLDYKGGSAFAPFADLPHTVGVLTDLDPEVTARALRALRAVLRHREAVLAGAGVPDATAYRAYARAHPDAEPMPRLVVIVDEYRILAEDHAPLMSSLVRIAALGRSLGLHLVLATQRPGGVVSAEIRANVNARIALRVRDVTESHDVIESGEAAALDPHLPGRGYLRVGSRAPMAFQAVRTAVPLPRDSVPTLRLTRLASPGPAPRPESLAGEAPTAGSSGGGAEAVRVIDVIVAAAGDAGQRNGHHRPAPVWAPPLPSSYQVRYGGPERSRHPEDPAAEAAPEPAPHPPAGASASGLALPLALVDDPDGRRVDALAWRPVTDGHLALVGTARTGRTDAVRALLVGLAQACPTDVHLYVIDAIGGLDAVAELPHCAGLVDRGDVGAVRRMVEALRTGPPPHSQTALTVLVVHGWEQVCAGLDELDHGRGSGRLMELLRGDVTGVRLLLTGDRGLLTGTVASHVEHKVVLRLADARDALMAGVRVPPGGGAGGPGRGVHLPSARAVQLGASTQVELSAAAHGARERHRRCPPAPPPWRPLPRELRLDEVPDIGDVGEQPPTRVAIGVAEDGQAAWVRTDAGLLVAGAPASGRSTTLRVIADGLSRAGVPVLLVCAGQPWSQLPRGVRQVSVEQLTRVWASRHAAPESPGATDVPGMTIIDDLDELDPVALESLGRALEEAGPPVPLVAAVRSAFAITAYTGVIGRLRRGDQLVLSPSLHDAQLLGIDMVTGAGGPAGRAALVRRGRTQAVQVARPT